MLKIYFGHHKCGSTWIIDVLLKSTGYIGLKTYYLQNHFDEGYYNKINDLLFSNGIDIVLCQSSSMKKSSYLKNYKGFHVIRDPRDICILAYYSHLYSHSVENWPELNELRNKLKQTSFEDGLIIEMDFLKDFFYDMNRWNYNQSNILEVKFEKLVENPVNQFIKILNFLGMLSLDRPHWLLRQRWNILWHLNIINRRLNYIIPNLGRREELDKEKLEKFINDFSFKKLSKGRKRGVYDKKSHYRKGVSGDWVNYFNSGHKQYFKEKYGELLLKLQYESTNNW
jgi:Sulfotransferase domain